MARPQEGLAGRAGLHSSRDRSNGTYVLDDEGVVGHLGDARGGHIAAALMKREASEGEAQEEKRLG